MKASESILVKQRSTEVVTLTPRILKDHQEISLVSVLEVILL